MGPDNVQLLGFAMELSSTLEEILDRRSQYPGKTAYPDEPIMLKRCRYLAAALEEGLRPSLNAQPTPPEAA